MIVSTVFLHNGRFEVGEVEVKLLPGIPQLNVVGLPDASMKECGIKLKSALRSCGLTWPQGHQIIVNLRPSYLRKHSSGVDLAIALGFLALTDQLSGPLREAVQASVVYGEIALNGRVFAPNDVGRALRGTGGRPLLTGLVNQSLREGEWWEIGDLRDKDVRQQARIFDWENHWVAPEIPILDLPENAAEVLALAVHMKLSVLLAGPQGTGKTTWAKALYSLTPAPDRAQALERADLFGEESLLEQRWRPLEQPHHTISPHAMVGGSVPLQPGVISRAHGGVLIMDEFLEFDSYVLESLREPMESGVIEIARRGEKQRWPADFQLVGTSNLCPCGRLEPRKIVGCNYSLPRCRSVCFRLSGPLMDRFDLLVYSHEWIGRGARRVPLKEVKSTVERLRAFAPKRAHVPDPAPDWLSQLELSHRRRRSLLRVARGIADLAEEEMVRENHLLQASRLVIDPMETLRRLFA